GTYTVPFGYSNTNYIPLTLTKTTGTGSGSSFIYSTYRTATWQNSNYLPTGITSLGTWWGGPDNSAMVIDRFWQIDANGYTTRPDISNLIFTYIDVEHSVASNTINEGGLRAQRYNSTLDQWGDYMPTGTDNTAANTVTVSNVTNSDFFEWWTLVD